MATVVDTVVLQYFLLVDESDLLLELLDPPVGVPRIVYDPDDRTSTDMVASELRRSIRYEQRLVATSPTDADRQAANERAQRLQHIDQLIDGGRVEVLDMTDSELDIFQRLTTDEPDEQLGLLAPLGVGEAACIAIALERDHVMATDDTDALRVLHRLRPDHPYERIRRFSSELAWTASPLATAPTKSTNACATWDSGTPSPRFQVDDAGSERAAATGHGRRPTRKRDTVVTHQIETSRHQWLPAATCTKPPSSPNPLPVATNGDQWRPVDTVLVQGRGDLGARS